MGTPTRQVVGVVRDARSESIRSEAPAGKCKFPYQEDPSFAMTLLIRSDLPVSQIVPGHSSGTPTCQCGVCCRAETPAPRTPE